jgi:hypothetical protein
MRFWKTISKRSVLALAAVAVAISWTRTGQTQAPCLIERGQDPLDILNSGIRHNVWIVLDTSGSMDWDMNGNRSGTPKKIDVAKQTLTEVIDEFVDAAGRPFVNWGFVRFANDQGFSTGNTNADCSAQFLQPSTSAAGNAISGCQGLYLSGLINPPACSAPSNTTAVKDAINGAVPQSNTPNGVSMDQISERIVSGGFVSGLLTNQKNFVILVSDGDDTCECDSTTLDRSGSLVNGLWTPTPAPPFAAGNTIPRQLRGSSASSNYTITLTGGNNNAANIQAANAGTKGRLLYERLNPAAADRAAGAKGGAFVIGLGLSGQSPARAHHMAWEASGAFYGNPNAGPALLANNKTQLKNALRDAFAKIGVPPSTVTLGAPTVGTVREVIPQYTNPNIAPDELIGDVGPTSPDPDDVREARLNRANHQNNVLFGSSVEVPGFRGHFTAHNVYRVTDPNNPRTARQADFTKIWDAGELLQQRSPDSRNILFNRRGQAALLPFTSANVTAADLGVTAGYLSSIDGTGALTANDARDMVIGVVRGYRLSKDSTTGTLYRTDGTLNFSTVGTDSLPTWKLYDAVAAPAVVGSPPRSPDFDPPQNHTDEYGVGGTRAGDGFYWDHFNRRTMVYLPTNGGMLHAFDGETGDEVFAYIPDDVMSLDPAEVVGSRDILAEFVALVVEENNGIQNHQFTMSGAPSVKDAFLRSDFGGDDEWHTVLAFGRGRGGRFLSVLDITDPQAPQLRFNVGNREGINDGLLDGMGETWSTPNMGNVQTSNPTSDPDRVDQWLAFLGGGYGCNNNAREGQYLFAIRVENGTVYHRAQVTNDNTAAIPYNAVVTMPTLYNPHQADVADNKDYITRAYVGDVQGVIWKLVTTDLDPNNWTIQKFAEVGKNQPITAPVTLLNDPNNQQVYVMAGTGGDLRVPAAGNVFRFVTYIDRDLDGSNTAQYALGSSPYWSKDLNPEERTYVAPVTIGTVENSAMPLVFFAASTPGFDTSTCTGFFDSSLYALGILSGQAEVDLDGGGADESVAVSDSKITGLYARDGQLYVSKSGGLGSGAGSVTVYGDGDFSDDINTGGSGITIQVLVDGFRISPF